MAKLNKAQRRAKRLAEAQQGGLPGTGDAGSIPSMQIPHQVVTDAPDPSITSAVAQGGEPIVRGNSNLQPMTPQGHQTIGKVGADLAKLGGPDQIIPSSAVRTQETAQDISAQTGAPVMPGQPGLESHALGRIEGEPKTPELKKFMADLIRNAPNFRIPGQGALSNRSSETFNEFKQRALSAVRGIMQRLASAPNSRIVVPTSTQVIKLIQAWAKAGCPDDFSIDNDTMLQEDAGSPGEMERFFPEPDGHWEMKPFAPKSAKDFPSGIYFLRHGETSSVQAEHADQGQRARAQIISHVRAGRYSDAKSVAQQASSAGHLSDDEIAGAIDESLPNANDAERLMPDQLMAAVSAAGPEKRSQLMPVLQRRFADLSAVSADGQRPLRGHLGRLGMYQK